MLMLRKNRLKRSVAVVVVMFAALAGCGKIPVSMHRTGSSTQMDEYAKARYEMAVGYMEQSRFELALEQFAIVAAVAADPELRQLALDGYAKVDKAIAVKR